MARGCHVPEEEQRRDLVRPRYDKRKRPGALLHSTPDRPGFGGNHPRDVHRPHVQVDRRSRLRRSLRQEELRVVRSRDNLRKSQQGKPGGDVPGRSAPPLRPDERWERLLRVPQGHPRSLRERHLVPGRGLHRA